MEVESIDKAAFDALYEEYAEKVYQIVLYYTGRREISEEITQEIFIKLYLNMDKMTPEYAQLWLRVKAKNLALNYNRNSTNREEIIQNMKPAANGGNIFPEPMRKTIWIVPERWLAE